MNKKTLLIGLAIFIVLSCVLPIAGIAVSALIKNLPQGGFKDVTGALFMALICIGPIVVGFGGLGWKIYHSRQSGQSAVRLGEALGLAKINQTSSPKDAWYGGVHDGRRFAIKPIAIKSHYYDDGRRRPSLEHYLRIVLEVKSDKPRDIVVYRRPGQRGSATTFEEAFHTTKNASRLTASAQEALLAFVQKGYETGLQGTTYRLEKGTRNLTLRDRAEMPKAQLSHEVLADAQVILVHDHPNPTLSADELNNLLDEMTAVSRAIEPANQPASPATRKMTSPFPAGSIGGISARIGYDVRDLYMAGFDRLDIADVEAGRITIDELWKRGPRK